MKRRSFLKGALISTVAGFGALSELKFDPKKRMKVGINQADASGPDVTGRCGFGMGCGGGGGQCGFGMGCSGGDGACGFGMGCSGS